MQARYYYSNTGRFISREPIWPQLRDPRELNPYQYSLNEPVGTIDITGLDNGTIKGYMFGDYYYVASLHLDGNAIDAETTEKDYEGSNGFQFRRIYMTYNKDYENDWSTRLRLEMSQKDL